MPEVFISYAWADNATNASITHEVTEPIDHFLRVYDYVKGTLRSEPVDSDYFFLDRTNIPPGERIPEGIKLGLYECPVMLAFCSPSYFKSEKCYQEWLEFKRLQYNSIGTTRLIIPVEVRPLNSHVSHDYERSKEWIGELTSADGLRANVSSSMLLSRDTAQITAAIGEIIDRVDAHILETRGSEASRKAASNVLVVQKKIEGSSLDDQISNEIRRGAKVLKYPRHDPVCIIYAGGTVGMVHQPESDPLHSDYEMAGGADAIVKYLRPKVSTLPFDMHFLALRDTIDSSNVTASDWVSLASLLAEQMGNYQGFVILHGTNTMAYTASALSFLLEGIIDRPVVLTGSEVPLSVPNTDALHNVENAIRAVSWQSYNGPMRIPEVCIYWDNFLHRGNRATKKYASDRASGFHTPNAPIPLAVLANDKLNVEYSQLLPVPAVQDVGGPPPPIADLAHVKVAIMFIHPDMDLSDLDQKYPDHLDGLLLMSYGPGNAPEDPRFIAMIKRLVAGGTIVGNVTQCPYGRVELKLFETSATLFDLGVVDGYDMTLEAAYTKLLWCIARRTNTRMPGVQENIKRTFQRNVAGEMSASVHAVSFGGSKTFSSDPRHGYLVSDIRNLDVQVDRYDIAEVFLRIEGLQLPADETGNVLRIVFGVPAIEDVALEVAPLNLLAEFTKTLTPLERSSGFIDKNLEITHPFRKFFNNDEFQISAGLVGGAQLHFTSIKIVVYTKSGRRV